MKKSILLIIITLFTVAQGFSQVDRTKAPQPAPAREIKLGEYKTFTLKNGLQVFVVENHKLPRVQFTLELKNNPIMEGAKAGYVSMAGDLMGTGTKTRSKAQLDEEIDFIGASLNTSSGGMFASSLSKHTDKLLDLMTDVLYNAAMSQEELDKLKTQAQSSLAAEKDDPGAIASNVRSVLVYGKNHPYGEITTEETVEAITLDDCKKYYGTYFKPNNAYLAIVGDIHLKKAKTIVNKYFGKWQQGDVQNPTYVTPKQPEETFVALVDRSASVQSMINISYPLELHPGEPDVIKAGVLNQILGGGFSSRLMQNLREDKAFTYGARSSISSDRLIGSFNASASVRNDVTDSAVYEFLYEMKRFEKEPVTDKEIIAAKASISGAFGRSLENPQTVANFALNIARYNLPKDYYANYVKNVAAVSKEDVIGIGRKYIRPDHSYIIVVGKGTDVAEKLQRFGKVKYFDIHGNEYTPKASTLPAGLTAEKVLENYINAIGGTAKVKAVQTAKMIFKAEAMGMQLTRTDIKKAPAKSMIQVVANGNTFQKMISDGKDLSLTMMGQSPPLEAKLKELQIFDASLFHELAYTAMGAKVLLQGVQDLGGKEAYVVEYQLSQGEKITEFYDKATGLKAQTLQTIKIPQGELTVTQVYSDYKEVKGVKFPHTIEQKQGPMSISFEITSLEVNTPADDALFKVEK